MASLATFLGDVLQSGRIALREPLPAGTDPDALAVLNEAYRLHALGVAGPPIAFDGPTALAAGRVLYQSAWYLLNANEPIDASRLRITAGPRGAAQHLSADLVLRYLPTVHRRARAM